MDVKRKRKMTENNTTVVSLFGSKNASISVSRLSKVADKLADYGLTLVSTFVAKDVNGVLYDIRYKSTGGGDLYGVDVTPLKTVKI